MNSLTWEDSCLAASPGRGVTLHPKGERRDAHESGLDVAFSGSVCLGNEELGLTYLWLVRLVRFGSPSLPR